MNTNIAGQMSLLNFIDDDNTAEKEQEKQNKHSLSDYAFLYTATSTGKNSGIRFMMKTEDAMKWCESSLSKGVYMGNEWAYFWTSVENFIFCHWGSKSMELNLNIPVDNGKYDKDIESLGLKKYGAGEIQEVLSKIGVNVKFS